MTVSNARSCHPQHQWGSRHPFRPAAIPRTAGLERVLPGPLQQQDRRR